MPKTTTVTVGVDNIVEGDLVYITKEPEIFTMEIVGWYSNNGHVLVKHFGKIPRLYGVFLNLGMTTDSGKSRWYNVIVLDKIYMFNGKQIFKEV